MKTFVGRMKAAAQCLEMRRRGGLEFGRIEDAGIGAAIVRFRRTV
ncbi:MAG: hypothetical protein RMM53_02090 [Bacteroidia bacterium]|nr:hypothetical protein [Bacteroidia bacterium]MDW8332985.1 hypothetical protein [Bacteroidia bacterium]